MEFTQCVEEAVTEIQFYYDGILLKQNEIIEELTRRVDRLEKTVEIQKSPFEADIIAIHKNGVAAEGTTLRAVGHILPGVMRTA